MQTSSVQFRHESDYLPTHNIHLNTFSNAATAQDKMTHMTDSFLGRHFNVAKLKLGNQKWLYFKT